MTAALAGVPYGPKRSPGRSQQEKTFIPNLKSPL